MTKPSPIMEWPDDGGGRLGLRLQARAASRKIKQTTVGKTQEMS